MDAQEIPFPLECDPLKLLEFKLEDGTEPSECPLHLTNPGSSAVAFKVKTTKPKRYLVRPNQGVISPSQKLPVSIVLLAQDKTELLQEYRQNGVCNETNKFMVQALPLEGAAIPIAAVPTDMWEKSKAKVLQKKLVVSFSFSRPVDRPRMAGHGNLQQASDGIREAVAGGGGGGGGGGLTRFGTGSGDGSRVDGGADEVGEMSQEQMWEQATALRQKYDDLVSFTINLTAEKDLIQRSLNATQEELQREQQARKQLEAQMMEPGARRAASVVGTAASPESRKGFSLFFVLLIAVAALFAGQWMASYGA